jgi:hypothetical protein
MTERRRKEIAESLRRLVASYRARNEEFEETLSILCRKLELDEISLARPGRNSEAVTSLQIVEPGGLLIDRTTFTVRWNARSCFLNNSLPFRLLERFRILNPTARRPTWVRRR